MELFNTISPYFQPLSCVLSLGLIVWLCARLLLIPAAWNKNEPALSRKGLCTFLAGIVGLVLFQAWPVCVWHHGFLMVSPGMSEAQVLLTMGNPTSVFQIKATPYNWEGVKLNETLDTQYIWSYSVPLIFQEWRIGFSGSKKVASKWRPVLSW